MVKILIGCAGWSYPDWLGVFYPKNMKPRQFLSHYTKYFDYTEVNSTFYNLPNEATVQKWLNDVPDDFQFTIKIWRNITHKKEYVDGSIRAFFARFKVLEPKIKGFLLQFPPQFKYTEKHYNQLKHILDKLRTEKPIFIEFRDNAWFDLEVLSTFIDGEKKVLVTNYKEGVKPIYLDNQGVNFIRLIGDREISEFNRIQRSQDDILEEVKKKLNSWERQPGIREALVTFNNHFRGFSPQDANEFREDMKIPYRDFKGRLVKEQKKQPTLTDFLK